MESTVETFLDESPLFAALTASEREIVEEHMYETHLESGETLFAEGDAGEYVCFVVKGSLQVNKKNPAGQQVELAVLHRGQSIGDMGIIDEAPRFASAVALEETVLMVLTRKGFDLLLQQHPRIGIVVLRSLAKLLSIKMREFSKDFIGFSR